MGVGQMRPHFSLGERNGRARSKRDIGGGFRFWPTVAAIRFPAPGGAANRAAFAHRRASRSAGAEHPPTGAHPRIRLAFSATGSASADSSKAACLLRHRRRCAAFPYSGLHPHGAAAESEAEPIRPAPAMCSSASSRADHWWVWQNPGPRPTRRPISKYLAPSC